MAKLTTSMRAALPKSTFAGPGRSFPIPDKNHAKAALIDIPKAKLSPASAAKIRTRAKAMLGK